MTCLILSAIFLLLPVLALLLSGGAHYAFYLMVLTFNLVWFFTLYFSYPGWAELSDGVLSFTEYYEVSKGDRKKISFAVSEVREVEFLQNAFEKKFNLGRIRFRGTAETQPPLHSKPSQGISLQLCGITHFDKFREEFEPMLMKK